MILPPYLNPIEIAFSKLNALTRQSRENHQAAVGRRQPSLHPEQLQGRRL